MSKKPVLMPKAERREAALQVALKLAKKVGAKRVSIAMVAAAQKVTAPLLFHIFESREGLTKAILKTAKAQGVVLPEAAPTVREARAMNKPKLKKLAPPKRAAPVKLAKLKAPAKPVKKLAPVKPPAAKKAAPKKLAALLSPKVNATGKLPKPKAAPAKPARKELTPAQKTAKAAADKARRALSTPASPAGKFASLPKPFEVAIQQVAA